MATKGIDVSVWQGTIDFNAVRNSGVDFVIIRAGYGTSSKDKYFEENYRNAKAAGLHIGAYWYSYADSFSEAAQEAEMFLSVLAGKQFDYPVFLDMEEKKQIEAGTDFCSGLIKTFCDRLEAAGYFAGFYTSASFARSVVTDAVPKRYCYWCAQWADACSYEGSCGIWQHSSNGSVPASMAAWIWTGLIRTFRQSSLTAGLTDTRNQLTILLLPSLRKPLMSWRRKCSPGSGATAKNVKIVFLLPVMIMIPCRPR